MPKNPQPPAVTDSIVEPGLSLESIDTPTDEHFNSLEQAMNDAGLGDGLPPAQDPPAQDPPAQDPPAQDPPAQDPPVQDPPQDPPAQDPPAQNPPKEDGEKEKELESLDLDSITPPPNVSPKNLVNFDRLREVAKHFKAKASRVEELEQQLQKVSASGTLPENVQKELEDHRKFRRIFDAENDPEFIKQHTEKLSAIDGDVISLLRRNGLPESVAEEITKIGVDKVPTAWWEKTILPNLTIVERERLTRRLAERADAVDQRQKQLEIFASQREDYLKQQDEQTQQRYQAEIQEINSHLDSLTKDVPWARPIEITPKMSKEEKKAAEAHNAAVDELQRHFQEALFPKTAKERAEVAAAAAASVRFAQSLDAASKKNEALSAEVTRLQSELDRIKKAGKLPSASSRAKESASLAASQATVMPNEDAIEQGLREAEGI